MRAHGEIEFEFRDDSDTGEFVACGKVLGLLKRHLTQGKIDEAATLLAACAENVGDDLIRDVMTGKPSKRLVTSLTEMFLKARDYRRAAYCAEKAGDAEMTAKLLEENYDLGRAAQFYERARKLPKAASLFERVGNFKRAAELFTQLKNYVRAAECLERSNRFFEAGQLYAAARRWEKTVEVLQKVPRKAPQYPQAVRHLGKILEQTGNKSAAMQRYLDVVQHWPLDRRTVDLHLRLATLCAERKRFDDCQRLTRGILAFDPQHAEARALAGKLPDTRRRGGDSFDELHIDLDGSDEAEPEVAAGPAAAGRERTGKNRLVGVDHHFEFLRQVPLFARLSLDELRQISGACQKITYPAGYRLITQGEAGEALYVIVRGSVEVTAKGRDGKTSRLGRLAAGAHVGEIALVDDGPTSANVVATEDLIAFRLPRDSFNEIVEADERIKLRVYDEMIKSLARRLRETNSRVSQVSGAGPPPIPTSR